MVRYKKGGKPEHWQLLLAAAGLREACGPGGRPHLFPTAPAYINDILNCQGLAPILDLGLYGIGGPLTEAAMRWLGPGLWTLGPWMIGRYQMLYGACGVVMCGTTFAALLWPRHTRSAGAER